MLISGVYGEKLKGFSLFSVSAYVLECWLKYCTPYVLLTPQKLCWIEGGVRPAEPETPSGFYVCDATCDKPPQRLDGEGATAIEL